MQRATRRIQTDRQTDGQWRLADVRNVTESEEPGRKASIVPEHKRYRRVNSIDVYWQHRPAQFLYFLYWHIYSFVCSASGSKTLEMLQGLKKRRR